MGLALGAALGLLWLDHELNASGAQSGDPNEMNAPTAAGWPGRTKMFCLGRFVLDVPNEASLKSIKGGDETATVLAVAPTALEDFRRAVQGRWNEIRPRLADEYGKAFRKPPEQVEVVPNGFLFNFDHVITKGPDVTGKVGEWQVHKTEAYLWKDDVAYTFDEGDEQDIRQHMQSLQPMLQDRVPTGMGFCGPRMFIEGGARGEFLDAHILLGLDMPLSLHMSMSTYVDSMGLNQLRPPKPSAASLPKDGRFRGHLLAEGKAAVGTLQGEEWIVGFTEQLSQDEFETTVTAVWFGEGAANSSDRPSMQLKLSTTLRSSSPPEPWGDFPAAARPATPGGHTGQVAGFRDEFLRAWTMTKASLRLRPGAL